MTGSDSISPKRTVCIVGAGPGGMAAARTLADHGIAVDLIDENARTGGATARRHFSTSVDQARMDARELGAGVRFYESSICHGFQHGRPVVSQQGALLPFDPVATIVAVGARERIRPIRGSLLAGVMACGAAQTLVKGSGRYPYASVVVAGSGPLLLATASQLIDAGVRVRAVVEESRLYEGLSFAVIARLMRALPGNVAAEGARYVANIVRHRAKLLSGCRVGSIEGDGRVQRVQLVDMGERGKTRTIETESVVLGYGFVSSSELVQQAGATMTYDISSRHLTPDRTTAFETSVRGLYSVGDCAGVQGKEVAELEGTFAAFDVLKRQFNVRVPDATVNKTRHRLRMVMQFQAQMGILFPQPQLTDVSPHAVVCRCENVTQAEVDEAIEHGARDFRSVKLWTRTGMGICQGRGCQPVLADYLTAAAKAEPPRAQFPVRPLPFRVAKQL